ncbi:MAG: hypothetical protein WC980_02445 [Candidatus Brocadiia bacterium]
MRHYSAIFLLILCLSLIGYAATHETNQSGANSGIAVGQWVQYHINRYDIDKSETNKDNLSSTSEADIKMSITGRQTLYEQELFWVELAVNHGKESQRIVRFLADSKGTPQPEKIIVKHGQLPAVEMNLRIWEIKTRITREKLLAEMLGKLNLIPLTRLEILDKPIVPDKTSNEANPKAENKTSVAGEPEISGGKTISITITSQPDIKSLACTKLVTNQPEIGLSSESLYSKIIPLSGLARLEMMQDSTRKKTQTIITITDFGLAGAESLINEKTRQLDFK